MISPGKPRDPAPDAAEVWTAAELYEGRKLLIEISDETGTFCVLRAHHKDEEEIAAMRKRAALICQALQLLCCVENLIEPTDDVPAWIAKVRAARAIIAAAQIQPTTKIEGGRVQ